MYPCVSVNKKAAVKATRAEGKSLGLQAVVGILIMVEVEKMRNERMSQ
jgi:hypothetical protein